MGSVSALNFSSTYRSDPRGFSEAPALRTNKVSVLEPATSGKIWPCQA
jgi:hypothetical protein